MTTGIAPRGPTLNRDETAVPVSPSGRHAAHRLVFPLAVAAALVPAGIVAVSAGATRVDWSVTFTVLVSHLLPGFDAGDVSEADAVIVWLIRTPRVIVAALVGGALAASGALMQGLVRNPMAEPNIIGVSAGAVLGAVAAFVTGLAAGSAVVLPLAAILGGLSALVVVYAVATRGGATPVATLLLSGIAISALLTAASSLLISLNLVSWDAAQEIIFWTLGGVDNRTWTHVWICAPFVVPGLLASVCSARDLDLMLQGEEAAAALGVEVESVKRSVILLSAVLTGGAVAVAGAVGFVGLIVPHFVRLIVGPGHGSLIPSTALCGAVFLILCDLLARTIHPPVEVRLGIVTAAFGAPFFLFLLVRRSREIV
jgi:iron complex transport system permease protein